MNIFINLQKLISKNSKISYTEHIVVQNTRKLNTILITLTEGLYLLQSPTALQ